MDLTVGHTSGGARNVSGGVKPLPFSPSHFLPFLPFLSSLRSRALSSPPYSYPPLEVEPLNPARGSGERCKLPIGGVWGRATEKNRFWCILALKYDNL